jgi:3-oxoadipate enol-lactonase
MDYSLEMLADDLFGLIDALEIDQLHYISLSMGGMIGQTAALKDQNRFLSLSFCDTSSRVLPEMQGA